MPCLMSCNSSYIPHQDQVIRFGAKVINRCGIDDLAKLEKRYRVTRFPNTPGCFYYEITISRNGEEEWSSESFFHLDVGFSSQRDDDILDYFCKLFILSQQYFWISFIAIYI